MEILILILMENLLHAIQNFGGSVADVRLVQNFKLPDFQAKNFTPSISPNFSSFSDKNTKNEGKWRNLHCWQ